MGYDLYEHYEVMDWTLDVRFSLTSFTLDLRSDVVRFAVHPAPRSRLLSPHLHLRFSTLHFPPS